MIKAAEITAGHYGQAVVGISGKATAGYLGQALAGDFGKATTGYGGQSIAGHGGCARAGNFGMLALLHLDNAAERYRLRVAYVGEDGILPDRWYRLDEDGQFVLVEEDAP